MEMLIDGGRLRARHPWKEAVVVVLVKVAE